MEQTSVSGSYSTGSRCTTIFIKCPNLRWIGNSVLQHHERKLKNVNGALEAEQWVNIRRNGNACFSNLPELKVVQCHASLLDARKEFSGKNKNHQQTPGFRALRNQYPNRAHLE